MTAAGTKESSLRSKMGIVKIFHCTVYSVFVTQTAHGNTAFAMQSACSFISSVLIT